MKKILFKKLSLLNFCGIRSLEISFGENLTTVSGHNGAGKTSIANAITYVLFGTDIKGNSLDIKTFDKEHKIIPEIEHSAELTVDVLTEDDVPGEHNVMILKRTLTDKWKGEECKNTYKYFINDELCTAGEFKKCVDSICDETTFRLTSSPVYFTSLPWKDQRRFLEQLVPAVTSDDIAQGEERFAFVVDALKQESIDKVLHHLRYKRNEIQEQLDKIPTRQMELDKALPGLQDWAALESEKTALRAKLVEIDNKIYEAKNGGSDSVIKEGIRSKIEFANKRKDNMEQGARNFASKEADKHQSDVINAGAEFTKAQATVDELKARMNGFTYTEVHINEQIEKYKKDIKEAGDEYNRVSAEGWRWNADDGVCPHCGQLLPPSDIARIKKESESRFNEAKAKTLKSLLDKAEQIKTDYAECKKLLEEQEKDRQDTTNRLKEANEALKVATKKKEDIDAETPQTYDQILSKKEEYKQVIEELSELRKELEGTMQTGSSDILDSLMKEREPIGIRYNEVLTLLAKREEYDRISKLIENVKKDKVTYQEQIDELNEKLDITSEYYNLSCSILEDNINALFTYVKWTLFRTKNLQTGEKEAFCECYHDGVPYSRLNSAAKINAGIDIANTISKYYSVHAPMILDECESVLRPRTSAGQQIRLYVTSDKELKIETPSLAVME